MKTLAPLIAVLLLGAAPAAAATSFQTPSRNIGCVISKAGARCVLFERELFPRPHVGESLVPSSTRVFK